MTKPEIIIIKGQRYTSMTKSYNQALSDYTKALKALIIGGQDG